MSCSDLPKGSPDLLASNIVAETNASLQASGVSSNNVVTLAGMVALGSSFPNISKSSVLNLMRSRSGAFTNLNSQMQFVGADIALATISANDTLICPDPNGNPCDSSRVGGVSRGWVPSEPVAVITDSYALGDLSAPHELGHVLGGQHEVESGSATYAGAETDARGYVDPSNTWMTMMGGYAKPGCVFRTLNNQPSCVRLPRWSNPAPAYNYMGLPTGVDSQSNMGRALGIQMPTVAGYYTENVALPGTTGAIGASRYGVAAYLNWAASGGVVNSYQLEVAEGSSKIFTLIYSGPSTSASYQVKPASFYTWRVRACNGNGCSPYTTRSGTI